MSHYRAKRHLPIREAMRGKAERDPRRERARARDQADRSDNTASRACRFEVSAEIFGLQLLLSPFFLLSL